MQPRRTLHDLDGLVAIAVPGFIVAVVLWMLASLVLSIPHGPGHSLESMTPFVVLRDAALAAALATFACMLAALVVRAWRRLGER